jgi:hypothetical protein
MWANRSEMQDTATSIQNLLVDQRATTEIAVMELCNGAANQE